MHETVPVVLQHALHRDGAREPDAKARGRRRLAQRRRSSKDALTHRSRERGGESEIDRREREMVRVEVRVRRVPSTGDELVQREAPVCVSRGCHGSHWCSFWLHFETGASIGITEDDALDDGGKEDVSKVLREECGHGDVGDRHRASRSDVMILMFKNFNQCARATRNKNFSSTRLGVNGREETRVRLQIIYRSVTNFARIFNRQSTWEWRAWVRACRFQRDCQTFPRR